MKGKNKQTLNPERMDPIEYQLASIYNAIVELNNTVKNTPAIDTEELKQCIKILREEGLIAKSDY